MGRGAWGGLMVLAGLADLAYRAFYRWYVLHEKFRNIFHHITATITTTAATVIPIPPAPPPTTTTQQATGEKHLC